VSSRTLPFAHAAGWLIIPLYVAGICTSYLLGHRAGLPYEHPAKDAVLQVEFCVFAVVGALQVMTTIALVVAIFQAGDTSTAYEHPPSLPHSP
jgi:hypothetical protein